MATYETGESVVGRLVCRGVQVVDVDSLSGTNSGRVHTLKVTAICDDKIQHCYVYQCQHRINAYILMDDFSTGIVKRTSSDVKVVSDLLYTYLTKHFAFVGIMLLKDINYNTNAYNPGTYVRRHY